MKQPLQPAGQILCAAAKQGNDLVGTQKPMPMDESDDFMVARRQLTGRNRGDTLKARKSRHFAKLKQSALNRQTCGIVNLGKYVFDLN
ncbi:MAG: hypothetical protein NTZ16_10985 [Verrucomicrobia bacterium]|nr:hypothetical protein [Verrucomicrobiota bacterium]